MILIWYLWVVGDEVAIVVVLVLVLIDLEHERLEGDIVLHGLPLLLVVHGGRVDLALLQDLDHSLAMEYLKERLYFFLFHLGVELGSSSPCHRPLIDFLAFRRRVTRDLGLVDAIELLKETCMRNTENTMFADAGKTCQR